MHVYVMYDKDGNVLYVGKSRNILYRMNQHFGAGREDWKDEVNSIKYMNCYSEVDMSIYEIYLINVLKPKYNAALLYSGESYLNLNYELIDYDMSINGNKDISKEEKSKIKELLKVYEDKGKSKLNTNYSERRLRKSNVISLRWCIENPDKYNKIIKNAASYFGKTKRVHGLKLKNLYVGLWIDFLDLSNSDISYLKKHINKANNPKDIKMICYLRNDYVSKVDSKTIDDKLSILRLVTIIKNSAIKNGEEVYAYIPSERMRNLLDKYLNDEL